MNRAQLFSRSRLPGTDSSNLHCFPPVAKSLMLYWDLTEMS
jgi:hypothetical protein